MQLYYDFSGRINYAPTTLERKIKKSLRCGAKANTLECIHNEIKENDDNELNFFV